MARKKQYSLKQRTQWAKEDYGLDYTPSPVEVGLAMTKQRVNGKRQPWQQVGSGADMAAELAEAAKHYNSVPTRQAQMAPAAPAMVKPVQTQPQAAPFQLPQNTQAMEFAAADMNQPLMMPLFQQDHGWNSKRSPFAYLGEKAAGGAASTMEGIYNNIVDFGRAMTAADLAQQQAQAQMFAPLSDKHAAMARDIAQASQQVSAALPQAANRLRSTKAAEYAGGINEKYNNPTGVLGTMGDVSGAVGGMLPNVAASMATGGFLGLPMIFSSAAGNAAQEARQGGADEDTALLYGLLSGGVEVATEKMFDGIPGLQTGKAKEALQRAAWSTSGQRVLKKIIDIFGEGAEEYVSEVAGAYLQKMWNGDKRGGWQTFIETQPDALYSGLIGALTSGVMNLPGDTLNAVRNNQTGRGVANSGNTNALISAGLDMPGDSAGYALASQLAQQQLDGGKVSNARLGELARSTGKSDVFMMPLYNGQSGQAVTKNAPVQGTEAGPRYSIQQDAQGKPYVEVDTDQQLFEGKSLPESVKIARQYLKEHFQGKTLDVGSGRAFVNGRTVNEYTYPANVRMDPTLKLGKMKASPELENLLSVSEFVRHERDDGRHANATGGWDVYKTTFKLDGDFFTGEVKVMQTDRGALLYDITQLKRVPRMSDQTVQSTAATSGNPLQSAPTQSAGVSSIDSIPNEMENVNVQTVAAQNQQARARALAEGSAQASELDALEKLVQKKGLQVQYVYQPGSAVDGLVQGDIMTVNLGSDSYAFGTAVHETGHAMKVGDAKSFAKFQEAVLRFAQSDEQLGAYAEQVRQSYTAQDSPALASLLDSNGQVDAVALDEEVSLKLAEQLVQDPEKLVRAVGQDRGLVAQFLDFVRGIKNSITIKLTGSQKAMLDEAERTLVNMLRGKAGSVEGQRYAILQGENGAYVQADRQVLTGDDPTQWERQLYDYVNQNIRQGQDLTVQGADGDLLTITEKTAWKMGYRNDVRQKSGRTRKMSDTDYAAKLRAAGHIDEIAQVSERGPRMVPDTKNHDFAKDGFNYRTAFFQDADGEMYRLTVSVGKNGEVNTVYNIGRMKKEASQLLGAQTAQVPESTAAKTSSIGSISNPEGKVNNVPGLLLPPLGIEGEARQAGLSEQQVLEQAAQARKEKQLAIIKKNNPAPNEYLTWIRGAEDIHTLEQAVNDPDWDYEEYNPDWTREMARKALRTGKITVYGSHAVTDGAFVTPSRMEAESYGGNGRIYEKTVATDDIAWIDPTQGQYAAVQKDGTQGKNSLNVPYQLPTGESLRQYLRAEYNLPLGDVGAERTQVHAETQQTRAVAGKAQKVQTRRENGFVEKVGEALSVPKGARREYLKPLAQQMAEEVKQSGRVSRQTADAAFEDAYSRGIVVLDEYYNQYKGLKDELRQTALTLDAGSRASREYNDLRTRFFGSLNLKNQGGTPVDVKYQDLAQSHPELFDAEVAAPLDQLQRIGEVAKSIQKTGVELDAYYGDDAADFKRFARNGFDDAVAKLEEDIAGVKRYEDDTARAREEKAAKVPQPVDPAQVNDAYQTARKLQRGAEKIMAQELLTESDKKTVEKLLRGDLAPEDVQGENRGAILRVFKAKDAAQQALAPVREYNAQRKAALAAEAAQDVAASDGWKDKAMGLQYSTETMERNLRDIIPDRAEAKALTDKYFTPIHEHEAAATRFKNELRARIRALGLSQAESEYLQIYGELAGRTAAQELGESRSAAEVEHLHKAELDYLKEHPDVDKAKIEDALKVFRDAYDQIFAQMNDAYIRNGYAPVAYRKGYFPHFTDTAPDSLVGKLAARMGFNVQKDTLPTDIAGLTYTFRPGRKWNPFAKQRTGFETTYDAVKGFDKYLETAADVIYHTEDIQRLRTLEDAIRSKNSEEGVRKAAEDIRNNEGLTDEQKSTLLTELYSKEKGHLNHFVQELNEYTNKLAGKKSIHDRSIEADTGRSVYQLMGNLESRVAANMVAVNPGSWLTNFIPLTQASAECSTGSMVRAAKETARAYFKDDGFADTSTFLTNRRGSEALSQTTMRKVSETLTKPMFYIDDFTSNVVTRAKYYDNLKAGMDADSAMKNADSFAASIIADRSKGSLPTIFERKNPLTRLLTMYQVEVNNQLRYLAKDLPDDLKDKGLAALVGALMKYTVGAYLFNDLYELLVGRRPALDFLGLANDALGDYTGYALPNTFEAMGSAVRGEGVDFTAQKKSAVQATTALGENVAEELPFVGGLLGGGRIPVSSALPDVRSLASNAVGLMSDEKNEGKALSAIGKELAKPAYYILPPMGGGQIKKAVEGISTVAKGGSYGIDSQGREVLQFPVEDKSLGTYAKGALFGKYALPGAQEYVDSGFKAKSAGYTAAYNEAVGSGMTGKQFRETWQALDKNGDGKVGSSEAVVMLPLLDLTDDQRVMLWRQTASDVKKANYEQAQAQGLGNEYVDLVLNADTNGNGSLSKEEIMAYLDAAILQTKAKRMLFELTSTAKNPY